MFALTVFGKAPITNESDALIESIRSEILRTTTESDIARLAKIVKLESKKIMEEITSDTLQPSRAQEMMSEYSTACKKVLSFAATLPAVH